MDSLNGKAVVLITLLTFSFTLFTKIERRLLTSSVPNVTSIVNKNFLLEHFFCSLELFGGLHMLIWSLLSIIGFGIVVRTLKTYELLHLFKEKDLKWMRNLSLLSIIFLNFIFRSHIVALWIIQFVIFLSPWWLVMLVQVYREKIIHDQMLPILDSMIIFMRSGASLRSSLDRCMESGRPSVTMALKQFRLSLEYRKNRQAMSDNPKIHLFFDEIQSVDELTHRQVERLRALRRRLLIESKFRQKSRQATIQVKAQAWIMAVMYLLLLLYICHEFGFWKNSGLIFLSSVVFLVGFLLVLKMGRSYQWKI
jgi:Flp pilus assembly protein TadB